MIIDFIDLFNIFHESDSKHAPNLTEERIYSYSAELIKFKDKVPIFSGATENDGIVGYVPLFLDVKKYKSFKETKNRINYYVNKTGVITIIGDGKAGLMTYRYPTQYPVYCMTIHCISIILKNDQEIKQKYPEFDGLWLSWFTNKYSHYFYQLAKGEGVPSFSKYLYEDITLEIPPISQQKKELTYFKELINERSKCEFIQEKYSILKSTNLIYDIKGQRILSDYLDYVSRNDFLTEVEIYRRSKYINKTKEKIEVISGAIVNHFGIIPYDETLHHISNRPCIQVVRVGKAGALNVLNTGNYAPASNCMLLYIKKDKLFELNIRTKNEEINYLIYIASFLQPLFFEIATSSDLSVFQLSKVIDLVKMDFIKYSPELEKRTKIYKKINETLINSKRVINEINNLIIKEIQIQ